MSDYKTEKFVGKGTIAIIVAFALGLAVASEKLYRKWYPKSIEQPVVETIQKPETAPAFPHPQTIVPQYGNQNKQINCQNIDGVTFQGFDNYLKQGYKVCEYGIDTINGKPMRGKINTFKKLPSPRYREQNLSDGSLKVTGIYFYQIDPDERFAGNDKFRMNQSQFWQDRRPGYIIFRR